MFRNCGKKRNTERELFVLLDIKIPNAYDVHCNSERLHIRTSEGFECRETKTKVIITANQSEDKFHE